MTKLQLYPNKVDNFTIIKSGNEYCKYGIMEEILKKVIEDTETEFGPIVPLIDEEEEKVNYGDLDTELPLIVLKNMVLFPKNVVPITVNREKSLKAINAALEKDKFILVFTQKDSELEDPKPDEIYKHGVLAQVIREFRMPDGSITVILRGRKEAEWNQITQEDPFLKASYTTTDMVWPENHPEIPAMMQSIKEISREIIEISPTIPTEAKGLIENIKDDSFLINFIATNISVPVEKKISVLAQNNVIEKLEMLLKLLQEEKQYAEIRSKIDHKTRTDIDKQQREYFLQQQLKSIREELGGDGNEREITELKNRAEKIKFSKEAQKSFDQGIQKLERMNPSTPDYSVVYNHLDLMLDLPWGKYTEDKIDLQKAAAVLDEDHYGMEKIKDRILEYLAVLKLKGDMKSPILCFVGPPGIGKTSLGKSIANSINRKYHRMSLGGLHDESEIRGHRKTYIGAMPGRVIQGLKKVESSNPVFILDEIDKIGSDFRGDPSSALLEVLDPEQNNSFYDNYLEVEYDLSKVLFIATANDISKIQPALRDRLEIIQLNGYSQEEKIEIAKKHLLPKQIEAHGLESENIKLNKAFYKKLISDYTMESGVRELDRQIASLMRHIARDVATNEKMTILPDENNIEEFLGKQKYFTKKYAKANPAGIAVGLAWTSVGGDILYIESALSEGNPGLTLTGNLGDVMKESATTAFTCLKTRAKQLDINPEMFKNQHLHIHVPEGATPKDGPSAGITMFAAMASAFTGRKVKPFLAMTGEISLRGQVLPVGGIKEKVLAAKRSGMKNIILCEENRRDIEEINPRYIQGLDIQYIQNLDELIDLALV